MKYRFIGENWEEARDADEFLDKHATQDMDGAYFEDADGNSMKLMYYPQHTYINIRRNNASYKSRSVRLNRES